MNNGDQQRRAADELEIATRAMRLVEVSEVPEAEMSEGSVEESTLSFQIDVLFDGLWYPLWVSGEVDGDTMTGSIELPEGAGTIPFTAARSEGDG